MGDGHGCDAEAPKGSGKGMSGTVIHLFDGPYVAVDGERLHVPEGSKSLLAYVALRHRRVERRCVSGTLWPLGDDQRAAGNLRSALWRLRGAGIDVFNADKWSIALYEHVEVDAQLMYEWAERIINGEPSASDLAVQAHHIDALDLLPGVYDDWAIFDRERMRQRTLHALETLSRQLTVAGRHADAVEAALTAVSADPLRESAQRALIGAHLAEANWAEARRAYEEYRSIAWRELGVEPSYDLAALVSHGGPVLASSGAQSTALAV